MPLSRRSLRPGAPKFAPRRCLAVAFASIAAVGFAACGDDDSDDSAAATTDTTTEAASAEEVTLTAVEYEFNLSATPDETTKSVTFQNDGEEFHVMIFAKLNEGFTVDEAFELEGRKGSAEEVAQAEAQPGKSTTVDLKKPLEPGTYAMLCPLPGADGPHYKLGQLAEFEVE
jgi:uncharacterized cupredoxin-like copper-binding protein